MAHGLALIVLLGLLADTLFRRFRLPGLVGMLLVGILCGPYALNLLSPELMKVSGDFRMIALIVILLRAGLELRRDTLNRIGKTAALMSCVPALLEGAALTLLGPFFLPITYLESALLAAILAAVSPAVVVPLMLDFIHKKKGTRKGIPTLILAASSVDDVFVIVIFSILMGMATGVKVNVFTKLLEIPESILFGVVVGAFCGWILYQVFTHRRIRATKMGLIVLGASIFLTWIEEILKGIVPVASLLGVMTVGFVLLEKAERVAHKISRKMDKIWIFAELLLFALVGAQVNIGVAWHAGLAGAALIFLGLIARSAGTYLSLLGTDLTGREKFFCILAYLPKATVQAAIGAVPLAAGIPGGEVILAVAVLSILLTAPIGAILIIFYGERVLHVEETALQHASTAVTSIPEERGMVSL